MTKPALTIADERGHRLNLLSLRPEHCTIDVLASRLAQINRYAGALPYPFSVAAHSVFVSVLCPQAPLGGLVHDTPEAFTGDLISPIKRLCPEYQGIEHLVTKQLYAIHGWAPESAWVKRADTRAWELECAFIKGRYPAGAKRATPWETKLALELCQEWTWREARDLFLGRYASLRPSP